ncbi:Protein-associating with the carboxyl-terminal domain of ezrin, partial [Nowakowskiella sp. JEL0078]
NKWVLGGLELSTPYADLIPDILLNIHSRIPEDIIPPEDNDGILLCDLVWTRDVYAIGHLIIDIIEKYIPNVNLNESTLRWAELRATAQEMIQSNPNSRPTISEVLRSSFFTENVVIDVVEKFLRELRALDPQQKRENFIRLYNDLFSIPVQTIAKHVLPFVLVTDIFAEPGADIFLDNFLSAKYSKDKPDSALLPKEIFTQMVVPFIVDSFKLRHYHVRLMLLKLIDKCIHELLEHDKFILDTIIFPEVVLNSIHHYNLN